MQFGFKACQSAAFRRAILPLFLLSGVSVCRLWRAILPLFLLSGVSVCRLLASNTAAVLATCGHFDRTALRGVSFFQDFFS
jgi:hypothetical protein